ncbi:MAG TPA: hypothetical protein DIV86_04585 [Alphaproteobacteria bacterium]|nr:hypothetical protein [Alphaproteobacteria bacterium]
MMQFESNRLDELVDGDEGLKTEFLNLYMATFEKVITDCKTAFEKNDQKLWHDAIHELKGSSMNLGFNDMANYCKNIEYYAGDPNEKVNFIAELEKNFVQLKDTFQNKN